MTQAPWRTIRLSAGELELIILPGIGGRLWDVVFEGRSLLFQNPDLVGLVSDIEALADLPTKSPQFNFPLWGGEKTWIAPDSEWVDGAPFPALDSAPYRVTAEDDRQVILRSDLCPISGLEIERRIALDSPTGWSIHHKVINRGPRERFTGIWSVLMLDRPARIALDIGQQAHLKPVFGEAGELCQPNAPYCFIDCGAAREFKVGMDNPYGHVLVGLTAPTNTTWLMCRTAASVANDLFAHGHNFEVFNSGDYPYCEAEWHSPARYLRPGERIDFSQQFQMWSKTQTYSGKTMNSKEQELLACMS